jgi:hypothetical protein
MRGPGHPVFDLVELLNTDDRSRLQRYARQGRAAFDDPA